MDMITKLEGYDNEVYVGKNQVDLFLKLTAIEPDYVSQDGISRLEYWLDNHKYILEVIDDVVFISEGGDKK